LPGKQCRACVDPNRRTEDSDARKAVILRPDSEQPRLRNTKTRHKGYGVSLFLWWDHVNRCARRRSPSIERLRVRFGQSNASMGAKPITSLLENSEKSEWSDPVILVDCLTIFGEKLCVIHLHIIGLASTRMFFAKNMVGSGVRRMIAVTRDTIPVVNQTIANKGLESLSVCVDFYSLGPEARLWDRSWVGLRTGLVGWSSHRFEFEAGHHGDVWANSEIEQRRVELRQSVLPDATVPLMRLTMEIGPLEIDDHP
jgi:hypothetical protein